jgi:hypothetical protein
VSGAACWFANVPRDLIENARDDLSSRHTEGLKHAGSPIYKQSEGYPQFKSFHAATLDDPSLFEPQQSVWTSQRQRWDLIDETLPASK